MAVDPEFWGAVVLDDIVTLHADNTERMVFAKPLESGIRVVASDFLAFDFKPPYYGDTVSLKFWKLLGINFGTASGTTPLTLVSGYRYIYNHSYGTFSVYDTEDVLIQYVEHIHSIGDMNIDFTIFNSHQFEIVFSPSDGGVRFIFPAKMLKNPCPLTMADVISNGVHNTYPQDRIRPYGITDVDNPTNDIKHIGGIDKSKYMYQKEEIFAKGSKTPDISALNYAWDINWDKTIPNNDFGRDGIDVDPLRMVKTNLRGVREEIDWLLPILSVNIYPMLLPILRPGEVNINRPVYEPWLIMGIPTRESIIDYDDPFDPDPDNPDPDNPIPHPPPIITDDPEDEKFIIPVFDLSPRFA